MYKRPKVYIAGKITGLEEDVYLRHFSKMERFVKEDFNGKAYNPAKRGRTLTILYKILKRRPPTWKEYMVYALKHLMKCDMILFLDNWSDSKGARLEHSIAEALGLTILYEK